jgi:hypothetical protein
MKITKKGNEKVSQQTNSSLSKYIVQLFNLFIKWFFCVCEFHFMPAKEKESYKYFLIVNRWRHEKVIFSNENWLNFYFFIHAAYEFIYLRFWVKLRTFFSNLYDACGRWICFHDISPRFSLWPFSFSPSLLLSNSVGGDCFGGTLI